MVTRRVGLFGDGGASDGSITVDAIDLAERMVNIDELLQSEDMDEVSEIVQNMRTLADQLEESIKLKTNANQSKG